jgi:hypothetical protein
VTDRFNDKNCQKSQHEPEREAVIGSFYRQKYDERYDDQDDIAAQRYDQPAVFPDFPAQHRPESFKVIHAKPILTPWEALSECFPPAIAGSGSGREWISWSRVSSTSYFLGFSRLSATSEATSTTLMLSS